MKKLTTLLMWGMWKCTPTCETITRKLSESMDHQLPWWDRLRIRIHLMGCIFCERYRDQLIALRRLLDQYTDTRVHTDIALSREEASRMKQHLKEFDH